MINLYLHEIWGELEYHQVDQNWKDIQSAVNDIELRISLPQNNLTATTDPGPNNDETEGYSELSRWYNEATKVVWILIDPAPGAAVWIEADLSMDALGSASVADVGTQPGEVPLNSMLGSGAFLEPGSLPGDLVLRGDLSSRAFTAVGESAELDKATESELRTASGEAVVVSETIRSAMDFLDLGSVSGTIDFNVTNNLNAMATLEGNTTINLTGMDGAVGKIVTLFVVGDNATDRVVSFSASVANQDPPEVEDVTESRGYILSFMVLPGPIGVVLGAEAVTI